MKITEMPIEKLKEILRNAPKGATHYDLETQQYLKTMCDGAYRFTQFNTWSHMSMSATDFIKADFCTIDAISKEFEARKDIIANLSAERVESKGVEQSDTISVNLEPKKCRIIDPALPYDELPIDAELKPDSKPEVDTRSAFEARFENFAGMQGNREQLDDFWRLARSEDGKGYEDHLIKVLGCWEAWQTRQAEIDHLKSVVSWMESANAAQVELNQEFKAERDELEQGIDTAYKEIAAAMRTSYEAFKTTADLHQQGRADGLEDALLILEMHFKRLKGEQGE